MSDAIKIGFRSQASLSAMVSLVYIKCLIFIIVTATFSTHFAIGESRKELRNKEVGDGNIELWGSSVQSNYRVDPSRVVHLSWEPRVFMYKGFLRDDECDLLVSSVQAKEGPSTEKEDDRVKSTKWHLAGTRSIVNDSVLARIEERISAWTLLPKMNGKPLEIAHSGVEETKDNLGYFGEKSASVNGERLMATLILYLSDVTKGGQILFPKSKLGGKTWSDCTKVDDILKPAKGNALLFFHVHLNASPDASSSHARCPVLEGEMWYATKSFLIKPIEEDKLLSESAESADSECTDEDNSCPEWAAIGECERNPVFMVGSPDYYGTCRKSCNAC